MDVNIDDNMLHKPHRPTHEYILAYLWQGSCAVKVFTICQSLLRPLHHIAVVCKLKNSKQSLLKATRDVCQLNCTRAKRHLLCIFWSKFHQTQNFWWGLGTHTCKFLTLIKPQPQSNTEKIEYRYWQMKVQLINYICKQLHYMKKSVT